MFQFKELNTVHLEISNRCQASCPMCPRKYHGGVTNENLKIADWTFDDFEKIFDLETLSQIRLIYFCGNFGDPIMNNDLLRMCLFIKDNSPNIEVRIHTNGGARTTSWWKELFHCLPTNHTVVFAIDGLEDTHHIYRIGTTYDSVINNAKAFIEEGGIADWAFIKFKHNEHQALEAEARSKKIGFKRFTVKNTTRFVGSDRFNVVNEKGDTIYYLEPPTDNKVSLIKADNIINYEKILKQSEINCYVLDAKEIYIDAHKNVFPCCFLASAPYNYSPKNSHLDVIQTYVNDFYDKTLEQYYDLTNALGGIERLSALKYSIKEIINDDRWQRVWGEYWSSKKLYTCARVCGKTGFSKPKDQFVLRVNND